MSNNKRVTDRLTLEEVDIIFKNFSGNKTQYNSEGSRNFSVVIEDPHLADSLLEEGWNLRPLRVEDGEPPIWHLPVQLNFEGRIPPRVYAIKSRGKQSLSEVTVAMLDHLHIKYVDLTVNPYNWEVSGKHGVKAYLHTLYATIDEGALDLKYDDLTEIT